MELTTGHYWILDAIFDGGPRLEWLLNDHESLRINYFTEPCPLPERELSFLLMDLVRWGMTSIEQSNGPPFWGPLPVITPQGGAAWEAWAEPDWSLYYVDNEYQDFRSDDETWVREFESTRFRAENESRLAEAIEDRVKHTGKLLGQTEIEVERHWVVTTWKMLPTSVTRTILVQLGEIAESVRAGWGKEPGIGFRRWRKRGFNPRGCFELVRWE